MKTREKNPVKHITGRRYYFNKTLMDQIVHLRNQLKSLNTFERSCDYNLTLIRSEGKTHYLLFKNWMVLICIFVITLSPLRKGHGPSFEPSWIPPLPTNVLCQVYLKMAQWFRRGRWKCEKFTDGRSDGRTTGIQKSSFELSAQVS